MVTAFPRRPTTVLRADARGFGTNLSDPMKDETMQIKKLLTLAVLLAPASVLAHEPDDSVVQWHSIVGVITAPNVDNPVAGISAGTFPWSVREGHAHINLATGEVSFEVRGLVLNGGAASGTTGPITAVTGTLVCNPATPRQVVIDTAEVPLSALGNAHFRGELNAIPGDCTSPLFLVRIGPSFRAAAGRWLATGAVRSIGDND